MHLIETCPGHYCPPAGARQSHTGARLVWQDAAARVGPCQLCALPRGAAGPRQTPCWVVEAARCLSGSWLQTERHQGPAASCIRAWLPGPSRELPLESVGKTQAGRGFNVQGTRILPSSNIDPKSFEQLLVLLFVAAFAEVASQKGKCNTVPTSATSWSYGSGRP